MIVHLALHLLRFLEMLLITYLALTWRQWLQEPEAYKAVAGANLSGGIPNEQ